jgi:hypothetical protein
MGTEGLAAGTRAAAKTQRKSKHFADSFLTRFVSGERVLDIRDRAQGDDVAVILPHAVAVDAGHPEYDKRLDFADQSQDAVVCCDTLQRITDYRSAIAEWFRVLREGGFLVVTVPHQFLFERKLTPPSRFDTSHRRFYTAASLLLEIEEALDPHTYRIRHLEEDDTDFDYSRSPKRKAAGCNEIVVVLERIPRPEYADSVLEDIQPKSIILDRSRVDYSPDAADGPTMSIRSKPGHAQKIVVMKLDHRGDFLMAKPAMLELRRRFPTAALSLVCGQWNAAAATDLRIFDDIKICNYFLETGPHPPRQRKAMAEEFARMMAGQKYDLAIDLRLDADSRALLPMIDADQRAGFGVPEQFPFLDIALPFINPTLTSPQPFEPGRFKSDIGVLEEFAIAYRQGSFLSRKFECLVQGPDIALVPGSYSAELDMIPLGWRFNVYVDVCANEGAEILARRWFKTVRRYAPIRFRFDLKEARTVRFRAFARPMGFVRPFLFRGARVANHREWHGPHQQELMYMLVCVAGLRMNNPYQVHELSP